MKAPAINPFANSRPGAALCTPFTMVPGPYDNKSYKPISPLFHRFRHNLQLPSEFNFVELEADGMTVAQARSLVAATCLAMPRPPQWLFFIDSDVLVPCDALLKLLLRASCHPEHDVYAGVYCVKGHEPAEPLVYGEQGQGALWNWTLGDILTTRSHGVRCTGMGLNLIRVSVFQRMKDAGLVCGDGTDQDNRPFFKTINLTDPDDNPLGWIKSTEDVYFYHLLGRLGGSILVDTSVYAGHVDVDTGIVWGLPEDMGPVQRAKFIQPPPEGNKRALDLGAGPDRRRVDGHVVETLDMRSEAGCDYTQDVRRLNLPSQHYDLVLSSHMLEHLPYADQQMAWAEIFRVCKPGGSVEIRLPNAEWAAARIVAGCCDATVQGVLMGGQGRNGVAFEADTHYTAFTPHLAAHLAAEAGFVDIEVRSLRDDQQMAYNLDLKARRPEPLAQSGAAG